MIIGKAYGTAYVAMNSKSIGADIVYAWDNAEIGMMDASWQQRSCTQMQMLLFLTRKLLNTEHFSPARFRSSKRICRYYHRTGRYRKYVIGAFEMLFTKREDRPSKKHGTV